MTDPAPNGRPPELINKKADIFLQAIEDGVTIEVAAEFAGINRVTLYRYLEKSKDENNPHHLMYQEFSNKYKKAQAKAEVDLLLKIQGDSTWQSKAWIMERRFPKRWAKDRPIEDTGREIVINFKLKDDNGLEIKDLEEKKPASEETSKEKTD